MNLEQAIEASRLPRWHAGPKAPIWWGMFGLILLEAVIFATAVSSYYYMQALSPRWPPAGIDPPGLLLGSLATVLLVLSSLAISWGAKAIAAGRAAVLRLGLVIAVALVAGFFALLVADLWALKFRWNAHTYGSLVWLALGLYALHAFLLLIFATAVTVLAWRGEYTRERHLAVTANALWWHFSVVTWVVLYAVIYLSPRFL